MAAGIQSNLPEPEAPVEASEHNGSPPVEVVEWQLEKQVVEEEKRVEVRNREAEPSRVITRPAREEVWVWYVYELCSYFVHTVLIPIVFPLIITHIAKSPRQPRHLVLTPRGFFCWSNHVDLYNGLTDQNISLGDAKFSPLEWTALSWAMGLVLVTPAFGFVSTNLDYGWNQQFLAGAATALGAFLCLPVGFFRNYYVFPFYIFPIVMAITIATASHSRHYGLMVRGFTGAHLEKHQFRIRRGVSGWLSLFATAAGCLGSALISTFTYYMLRITDKYTGLWIVSIFSGLKWVAGSLHLISLRPGEPTANAPNQMSHSISIFKYPHAVGSLIAISLSSFTTMCIFGAGLLFLVGDLCLESKNMLYLLLIYFILPLLSLPLAHLVQLVLRTNAVKMQILGLILSLVTSGFGFYFRGARWKVLHVLVFGALQGTSAGILHAFGRVLVLDCSPRGQEGAFSVWLSWMKMAGTCAGYALASSVPGGIRTCFGVTFLTASAGIVLLIFGNISDVGGAVAAGNVSDDSEMESSHSTNNSLEKKGYVEKEAP